MGRSEENHKSPFARTSTSKFTPARQGDGNPFKASTNKSPFTKETSQSAKANPFAKQSVSKPSVFGKASTNARNVFGANNSTNNSTASNVFSKNSSSSTTNKFMGAVSNLANSEDASNSYSTSNGFGGMTNKHFSNPDEFKKFYEWMAADPYGQRSINENNTYPTPSKDN